MSQETININGRNFPADFERIASVKGDDRILIWDSSTGLVMFATPSQINAKFDQLVADIATAVAAAAAAEAAEQGVSAACAQAVADATAAAAQSAADALGYKNAASGKAEEAAGSAGTASSKANEASGHASDALGYKNAAAESAAAAASAAETKVAAFRILLENGTVIPALAVNLQSWDERSSLSVQETFTNAVRTAAGDQSILSGESAALVSIAAKNPQFSASAFRASGFNLLHNATAVGTGYYFPVPALPFGTYGTATKPNGLLFTDNNGGNLTPTVRFKARSAGVPTTINDGDACPYTDSNGKRFYNPTGEGYIIVSGITYANTCAHVAWSRRYDEFISPTQASDAGSSISLTSLIAAVHSYGQLLSVGGSNDRIDFTATKAIWHRRCERTQPTWATTQNEDGTYTHTATIATMKPDGAATLDGSALSVNGTVVSYSDSSSSASSSYVYFELATEATGNVTISPSFTIEDWGLEYLEGAVGEAYITAKYAQGYPDSLAALVAGGLDVFSGAIAHLIASLEGRIASLEKQLSEGIGRLIVEKLEVRSRLDDYSTEGNANAHGAGAPNFIPVKIGQRYFDDTNKVWYTSTGVTSASQWKLDTNA